MKSWGRALGRIVLAAFVFAAPTPGFGADQVQGGYSVEPLADPIFTSEQVATEVARMNNWLIENYTRLEPQRRQVFLEGLYVLLSSYVAHTHAEIRRVLPSGEDLLLRSLLSWAEPLGAYGGHLAYNEMLGREDLPDVEPMPALLPVPPEFALALEGDMLRLSSARGGWSVEVPYYFMVFGLSEFDTKNGPRTQLAIVSTGAAKHEGIPGQSQGSLRLFAGPGQSGGDFARYWQLTLGFDSGSKREALGIADLKSLKRFDAEARIHTEIVSWQGANGPLVVYYAGVQGVYEANRAHFLDFVRSLRGEL